MWNIRSRYAALAVLALTLGACESVGIVPDAPPPTTEPATSANNGGLIDKLFGSSDQSVGSGSGIAVNSYLWRASLDTMSFMPLSSADPFGGVIITDWYTPPESPNERVKVNIYILDRQLRADGLRISVFRQARDGGLWQQASVDPKTIRGIENAILRRARELRIANLRTQ